MGSSSRSEPSGISSLKAPFCLMQFWMKFPFVISNQHMMKGALNGLCFQTFYQRLNLFIIKRNANLLNTSLVGRFFEGELLRNRNKSNAKMACSISPRTSLTIHKSTLTELFSSYHSDRIIWLCLSVSPDV